MEDLLAYHGAVLIDRVESCARSSPSFKGILGIVWKNAMSDDVRNRVKAIGPPLVAMKPPFGNGGEEST
jgi:hypothetical protein